MTHDPAIKALEVEARCLEAAARQTGDAADRDRLTRRAQSLRGSIAVLERENKETSHGGH